MKNILKRVILIALFVVVQITSVIILLNITTALNLHKILFEIGIPKETVIEIFQFSIIIISVIIATFITAKISRKFGLLEKRKKELTPMLGKK